MTKNIFLRSLLGVSIVLFFFVYFAVEALAATPAITSISPNPVRQSTPANGSPSTALVLFRD
ncbi:MAG: hypothetical protein HYV53_00505 [Parcubacteria group bacterium]|nr:hypothetical protein [Parcubacteria group bacterium]